MKNYLLTTLLLLFSVTAFTQIREREENMSLGKKNALVLNFPQTDQKLVEKAWEDFTKDELRTRSKWDRKENEYLTDDVTIRELSTNTIDLHARAVTRGEDVDFTLWFNLGGAFLSSNAHADIYPEAEKLLMRFGLAVAAEKTRIQLDEQEKVLKEMERELDKLQKLNERYHKDIEKAQEAIKQAEKDIEDNLQLQEDMRGQMDEQQKLIEEIKKKLKDLK